MNPNCFKATYQGDTVWFILDDSFKPQCPERAITYTLPEAEALAKKPDWTRKIVHEAKKKGAQLKLPTPQSINQQ